MSKRNGSPQFGGLGVKLRWFVKHQSNIQNYFSQFIFLFLHRLFVAKKCLYALLIIV